MVGAAADPFAAPARTASSTNAEPKIKNFLIRTPSL
jgi:hypothetical protein